MVPLETVELIERFGLAGAIVAMMWWVLKNHGKHLKEISENGIRHEERSLIEHKALIDVVQKLAERPCQVEGK